MKKTVSLLMAFVMAVCLFSGCEAEKGGSDGGTETQVGSTEAGAGEITDMLGRRVDLPEKINRVVCIGAGALRLYTYVGELDLLCGVEECEKGFLISARPYRELNEERFLSLPSIGAGGPQGSPDAEAIIAVKPDIIFSLYTADSSAMDELSAKTGVPVVVLSYGKTEAFDEQIMQSLELMGTVLGRTERAQAVIEYINGIKSDLDGRTRDIADADKPTVYLGCHSKYGTHGIGSSAAGYSLFDAVHAKNVLDINGFEGYQGTIDLETLVTLSPDVIILDAGGLATFREEYAGKKDVFMSLTAFKTDNVYVQMPYNAYYTNIEIALADAYYCGKVLYPEQFADVEIEKKFDEISTFLLGGAAYEEVKNTVGGGYRRLGAEELS